jgi:predicted regulator of Ras-like GTPase activity (Roadblock/LC7/MglB family)
MSNSVKTKFAGLLRGLLNRLDENNADTPQTPRVCTSTAFPHPAPPVSRTPSPTPAFTPSPLPAENPDELQLPLQPILAVLPMDLRTKIIQAPSPDAVISVPLGKIMTQLAFGSVKLTFGELRHAAPDVFVNSGGEHDNKPVTLPLNEILTRLNPSLLSCHPTQKHIEVAEEIAGPFGAGGEGAKISVATKPTPSTATTPRTDPSALRMVAPVVPSKPAFVPRTVTPAASVSAPPPSLSHNSSSLSRNTSLTHDTSLSQNTPFITRPAAHRDNGAPKPIFTAPAPAPAVPISMDPATISAPLTALAEHWPEGLRLEIIQSDLAYAQVSLPMNLIEPALKRGRITFTWRSLRPLIKPTPPPASVHDGIELELPLSVVAPLFFTRHKGAPRFQTAVRPPDDIPNLFFGFPQPESPPPPAKMPEPPPSQPTPETQVFQRPMPEPPAMQPAPEPQTFRRLVPEPPPSQPSSRTVDAKPADSNYFINTDAPKAGETEYKSIQRPATDFTSRYATPKEIVERAKALPGVAGVVMALPDGLRVASQVPSDLNADTLAAFLPQIFDRVSQGTRELRMGSLNNFNFTVGNVPWRIYRVNAVYFAAFGSAGEVLPGAKLALLAAELDRKKQ